jgi:precorrin-2 dehydrogenase/sirohydrochlorin ferrochelatase
VPFGYQVFLELAGRTALVIGEEAVRVGKVEGLLEAGCDRVLVVATGPAARLDAWEAGEARVEVRRRGFEPGDLDGAFLVVASIDDETERVAIAREGRRRGVLVNVMDDVPNCDWSAPAVVRRGDLVLAISTGGRSPALAKRLRVELGERFGPEWDQIVAALGAVRDDVNGSIPSLRERSRRWSQALDLEEAAGLVRDGRRDELERRLRRRLSDEA